MAMGTAMAREMRMLTSCRLKYSRFSRLKKPSSPTSVPSKGSESTLSRETRPKRSSTATSSMMTMSTPLVCLVLPGLAILQDVHRVLYGPGSILVKIHSNTSKVYLSKVIKDGIDVFIGRFQLFEA